MRVAILDDYQGVALAMADWSVLAPTCDVQVFRDHLFDIEALAERLRDFEIVTCMPERTPFGRDLLKRLPNLRLLVTTGMRNAAIDLEAATDLGIQVCGTASGPQGPPAELTWGLILALARHIPGEDYVTEAQYRVRYRDTVEDVTAYLAGAPLRVLNPQARATARPQSS